MPYDELVKRLRAAAIMSEALSVFLPHSEGSAVAKLYNEAADAIEERCQQVDKFAEEAARLYAKQPKWIPVTERLPEHEYGESASVLTVDLYGVMRVTYFDGGNWCWPSGETLTTTRVAPITHWMPLPKGPEDE